MAKNTNLHSAKKAKNDEFYTQLTDIENEMNHYRGFFKDKIVYCNCDDARKSNFFKYFSLNFEFLGLKQLICTAYNENGKGVVYTYNGDLNGNKIVDDEEIDVRELEGNGDFRSEECIEILKSADVVVTNPPFSLFREYVAQLIEYDKKFLIIGNMNAVTYKEIFPLIKENKLWLGVNSKGGSRKGNSLEFITPNQETKQVSSWWYTNIDNSRRNTFIDLYKKYNEEEYPYYDNYDAINVNRSCEIPMDYNEVIGVPISFLMFHCPAQFEIIAKMSTNSIDNYNYGYPYINGNKVYARILIKIRK